MSELEAYQIQELKQTVAEQKERIDALEDLVQRAYGMGQLARWGMGVILFLAGIGGLSMLHKLVQWLQGPIH